MYKKVNPTKKLIRMILIKINQEADYNNEVYDACRNYRSTQTGAHQPSSESLQLQSVYVCILSV